MRKRPLCLVWIGLMLVILVLRSAGAPVFGEPVLDRADCAMLNGARVTGRSDVLQETVEQPDRNRTMKAVLSRHLPEGGAVLQARGRIISRKETEASFQYVLKDVQITQIKKIHSDQDADSCKSNAVESDSGNDRSVYFPYLLFSTEKDVVCRIGAEVQGTGIIRRIEAAGNPGQFDARRYYACMKLYYSMRCKNLTVLSPGGGAADWISLLRNRLTQNLKQLLPEDSAGVLAGMLLGERVLLDDEIRRDYQIGGIMHILAISGLHISMLGMGLFMLLQYLYFPMPAAAVLASFFMAVYCMLVGNPSSSVRAIVMFAVSMGAWITKRSYDWISALSLAGILILLTNPGFLFLAGFQLSFAAVIGTSAADVILHDIEKRWKEVCLEQGKDPVKPDTITRRTGFFLLRAFCSYLVMTLITMPLIAYYYYEIPVFSFFTNLLIVPLTGPVLALGAAGSAASLFSFFLAGVLLFPVHICIWSMSGLLHLFRNVPGCVWICGQPSVLQVILYYLLVTGALILLHRMLRQNSTSGQRELRENNVIIPRGRRTRFTAGEVYLLFVLAILLLMYRPAVPFSFTALDVGQGDGLVVRGGRRTVFLIDGGSSSVEEVGTRRIIPYLKQQGIRQIDGIWISHGDLDHISGMMELLQAIAEGSLFMQVRALYLPEWMKETETADRFWDLCRKTGTGVYYVSGGDCLTADDLEIRVLYPFAGMTAGGNERSMVLRVSYGTFDLLLTGDLEGSGEQELLSAQENGAAGTGSLEGIECLKVAHHGSRNASTKELLDLADPKVAVISAGRNNRYGHPHAETLERLAACGAEVFRTDLGGAVNVTADDGYVRVETYR